MSVKSFDESEACEKRVKSKKITHTNLFFSRGRRIMTQRRIDMHTPFDDGIFLPLFLLHQTKKREKFAGEGKMWDLASPKSLSLQTVSRLLFFFVGS